VDQNVFSCANDLGSGRLEASSVAVVVVSFLAVASQRRALRHDSLLLLLVATHAPP
jgi:hypothetical protein